MNGGFEFLVVAITAALVAVGYVNVILGKDYIATIFIFVELVMLVDAMILIEKSRGLEEPVRLTGGLVLSVIFLILFCMRIRKIDRDSGQQKGD